MLSNNSTLPILDQYLNEPKIELLPMKFGVASSM